MPRLYVSSILAAPIDQVWPLLRDFGYLAAYYSAIEELTLSGGAGDQVGCVRTARLKSGAIVHERLLALSDLDHSGSYSATTEGTPVENLVATHRLRPVTDRDATFIEWTVTFDTAGSHSAGIAQFLEHQVYRECIRGLEAIIAGDGSA